MSLGLNILENIIGSNNAIHSHSPTFNMKDFFDYKNFRDLLLRKNINKINTKFSFVDPENAKKPFSQHYEQYIHPHVIDFEKRRVVTLNKFRSRSFIVILAALLLIVCLGVVLLFSSFTDDSKELSSNGVFFL
ncbi:MAG: hypothetical protein R3D71_04610 [Rickettsiales bacterium]